MLEGDELVQIFEGKICTICHFFACALDCAWTQAWYKGLVWFQDVGSGLLLVLFLQIICRVEGACLLGLFSVEKLILYENTIEPLPNLLHTLTSDEDLDHLSLVQRATLLENQANHIVYMVSERLL